MTAIQQLRDTIQRKRGELDTLTRQRDQSTVALVAANRNLIRLEKIKVIIQTVARMTQEQLEYHVSEISTLALATVFPRPYKLKLSFTERRNRTEADIVFVDSAGNEFSPISDTGGGAVDVAAFGLRLSLWTLAKQRSRGVILLDEPFRFLSKDLQPKAGEVLKQISARLGVQFIIITQDNALVESADRVFRVEKRRGISQVTQQ